MKVAISCQGMDADALIDSRFGRCTAFAVYDTESRKLDFVENPNKDAGHGAGPASVALIANLGVGKVISGEFGFKVRDLLANLNIQMVIMKEKRTVREIINLLK